MHVQPVRFMQFEDAKSAQIWPPTLQQCQEVIPFFARILDVQETACRKSERAQNRRPMLKHDRALLLLFGMRPPPLTRSQVVACAPRVTVSDFSIYCKN